MAASKCDDAPFAPGCLESVRSDDQLGASDDTIVTGGSGAGEGSISGDLEPRGGRGIQPEDGNDTGTRGCLLNYIMSHIIL